MAAGLLRALQKPEESVRSPSTIDDTILDGQSSNLTRELLSEQNPETIAGTISAVASQLKQILYGNSNGRWSDVPVLSLLEIQELLTNHDSMVVSCLATTAIGDLVYHSPAANNFVITTSNNLSPEPVIGYVIGKPTIVTAHVTYHGILPTTLARGKVFVGSNGKFSLTVPTVGFLQNIGQSFGDGRLLFKPTLQRTRRK